MAPTLPGCSAGGSPSGPGGDGWSPAGQEVQEYRKAAHAVQSVGQVGQALVGGIHIWYIDCYTLVQTWNP